MNSNEPVHSQQEVSEPSVNIVGDISPTSPQGSPQHKIKVTLKQARLKVNLQNEVPIQDQIQDLEKPTPTSGTVVSKKTPNISNKPTRIVILKPPEKEDKPIKNRKKPLKKPSGSKPNDMRNNTPNITKYLRKENTCSNIASSNTNICTENTEYEQKHVPKLNSTSPENTASERGPTDSTPVHPDDVGSVHQAAPAGIISLTNKPSISTLVKTENGKSKHSLSSLLVKPRTK